MAVPIPLEFFTYTFIPFVTAVYTKRLFFPITAVLLFQLTWALLFSGPIFIASENTRDFFLWKTIAAILAIIAGYLYVDRNHYPRLLGLPNKALVYFEYDKVFGNNASLFFRSLLQWLFLAGGAGVLWEIPHEPWNRVLTIVFVFFTILVFYAFNMNLKIFWNEDECFRKYSKDPLAVITFHVYFFLYAGVLYTLVFSIFEWIFPSSWPLYATGAWPALISYSISGLVILLTLFTGSVFPRSTKEQREYVSKLSVKIEKASSDTAYEEMVDWQHTQRKNQCNVTPTQRSTKVDIYDEDKF